MAFLKKLLAFFLLLVACGYLSVAWEGHRRDEALAEDLVRGLGTKLVAAMAEADDVCRATARVDSVSVDQGWFSGEGSARLYLAGRGSAATTVEYQLNKENGRLYAQPADPASAKNAVIDFVSNRCS